MHIFFLQSVSDFFSHAFPNIHTYSIHTYSERIITFYNVFVELLASLEQNKCQKDLRQTGKFNLSVDLFSQYDAVSAFNQKHTPSAQLPVVSCC